MRTYTFPDYRPAGVGPWNDEPDKAQWIDEATDLDCLIMRSAMSGALCGYVGVPPGHPWHGKDYGDLPVDVHGSLTFASFCQEGAEDGPGICHVPESGRPANVWWLEFGCAQAFDLMPAMEAMLPASLRIGGVYRDFAYVQAEVAALAAQVHRAADA